MLPLRLTHLCVSAKVGFWVSEAGIVVQKHHGQLHAADGSTTCVGQDLL
jgi:hypothetical protein